MSCGSGLARDDGSAGALASQAGHFFFFNAFKRALACLTTSARSPFFRRFHSRISSFNRPQPVHTPSRILQFEVQGFSLSLPNSSSPTGGEHACSLDTIAQATTQPRQSGRQKKLRWALSMTMLSHWALMPEYTSQPLPLRSDPL